LSAEQAADVTAPLTGHPWIAVVTLDSTGVRLRPSRTATAVRPMPGPLIAEYLEHWGEVYDVTYSAAADRHAEDMDLSGWRASDTGEPFPVEHMAEWVDRTVDLVLGTRPRRVLELGCGTGLLAHRLRPHLAGYVGTDVAQSAIDRLAATADPACVYTRAAAHEVAGPAVRAALTRAGFPAQGPDCVLVNSVTQHFPNVEYLTTVVAEAIGLLAPGGSLIVGDIRHAGLLMAHSRWIEAATSKDPSTVEKRAQVRAERDDELNLDPPTLAASAAAACRTVDIRVHPKALSANTELTRYRFDAVLRVDTPASPAPPILIWSGMNALRTAVDSDKPVRVEGVPNRLLRTTPGAVSAHELYTALSGKDAAVVVDARDPELLAVVVPASAAATPVAAMAALPQKAHEPFAAFLTRRLAEVARTTLRRAHPGMTLPVITVEIDPMAGAAAAAQKAIDGVDTLRMPALLGDLDQVALLAMAANLAEGCPAGTARTAGEIADTLSVAERHRWIVRRWLTALVDSGMLTGDGQAYRGLRRVSRPELDEAVQSIDPTGRALGYPPELIRFFQTAIEYLPELLRDEVALQALLFADGETGTADGAYRDNPVNRYVNAAAAHLIGAHASDRTIRVLEVGAGVGGTTPDVLAALAGRQMDYLFTDLSRFFLVDAEKRFAGTDGLRFGIFDINGDLAGQGVAAGLDVVLGANVLHNAHDIGATLRGLRDLLAPGGLLVFVDTTREIRQLLTSMYFLMSPRPGHDCAGSGDARAGTDRVLLTAAEWTAELTAAGFEPLGRLPAPGHPLHPMGVQVFAAYRPR
jgi:SAM-dependent methyltransferase